MESNESIAGARRNVAKLRQHSKKKFKAASLTKVSHKKTCKSNYLMSIGRIKGVLP